MSKIEAKERMKVGRNIICGKKSTAHLKKCDKNTKFNEFRISCFQANYTEKLINFLIILILALNNAERRGILAITRRFVKLLQ